MGRAGGTAFQAGGTASAKAQRPERTDHSPETAEVCCEERESGPSLGSDLVFKTTTWSCSRCSSHFKAGSTRVPTLVVTEQKPEFFSSGSGTGVPSQQIE